MARIPAATRESVPQDQVGAFDELVASRGSVPQIGPVAIQINAPELAKRGEHLRAYIRADGSTVPQDMQELAMITTARELDCQFIWEAHAAAARKEGLSDELVDSLRDKKELPALSPQEAAVINYGREFFRTHRVSQPTFDAAMEQFGLRGLVELTNLMGYYSCLAFNINAFDVGLPAELKESPLPV
ncbi:MAG TPA: hypothetical protein DCE26_08975 [Dehalococcoidia bacterium]|nr:hypothetical protein [Chloroflexota bacterium]MQF95808.1 hypothetical protein [SAR202 cluster bacterium]HAA95806.1 hypothetical protein [Dehalococcoidia bacterium]|tara:strand:- start:2258 stop:2818 length:561 start_codon:yes stop_codon:yes gene_type:complete